MSDEDIYFADKGGIGRNHLMSRKKEPQSGSNFPFHDHLNHIGRAKRMLAMRACHAFIDRIEVNLIIEGYIYYI